MTTMMIGNDLLVAIAKTAEPLLTSGIPHVELDGAQVGVEEQGMYLDAQGGCEKGQVAEVKRECSP
jgi:hypothetical protein